jgi:hypothetical protein
VIPESCPLSDKYKLWAKLHQKCITNGVTLDGVNLCQDCYYYKKMILLLNEVSPDNIRKTLEELLKDQGLPNVPLYPYYHPNNK